MYPWSQPKSANLSKRSTSRTCEPHTKRPAHRLVPVRPVVRGPGDNALGTARSPLPPVAIRTTSDGIGYPHGIVVAMDEDPAGAVVIFATDARPDDPGARGSEEPSEP
jgi:hypothetical protein